MNPDALEQSQAKHAHQNKRASVADERKRESSDGSDADGHAYIHEGVGEKKKDDADGKKPAEWIIGLMGNPKSYQDKRSKSNQKKNSSDKSMLLAQNGKNKIVMHDRARKVP